MKTWIRRTLIGLASATALFGGLAAWAGHSYGHFWHGDATERQARMVDFATRKLELDPAQKAKLEALAGTLQAQRKALVTEGSNPRAELQQLIAGASFDRTQAAALLQAKLGAVQLKSPEVIAAFGDFFDSLRPDQQARLREALARGRHGGRT